MIASKCSLDSENKLQNSIALMVAELLLLVSKAISVKQQML